MDNNTITYYTLDEAKEILRKEARRKRLARKKREAEHRVKLLYFLKQKLMGLVMVIISILIPIVLDGDATASLITLPIGIYLIFTKEEVIYK